MAADGPAAPLDVTTAAADSRMVLPGIARVVLRAVVQVVL